MNTPKSTSEKSQKEIVQEIISRVEQRTKEGETPKISHSELLELREKAGLIATDEQLEEIRITEESQNK